METPRFVIGAFFINTDSDHWMEGWKTSASKVIAAAATEARPWKEGTWIRSGD